MSVHPDKRGWTVRFRQGSKNRSRRFSRADGFSKADAEAFDQTVKRRRKMGGVDPLEAERDFRRVVDEWWRGHANTISESTRDKQRAYLEKRILPHFEGLRLCDITPPEVRTFLIALQEKNVGAPTQRKLLYVLSAIFTYAQSMGYVVANPVAPIKKPKAERQRLITPFPPETVEALRGIFLHRNDLEGATMISVLAYAGPRPEEAHDRLTWSDISHDSIIFRGEKNDRDRSTRLLAPLRADLRAFQSGLSGAAPDQREPKLLSGAGREGSNQPQRGPAESDNILPFTGGKVFDWTKARFNSWRDTGGWRKAVDELDLKRPDGSDERARPYDLRHSFSSLLLSEGNRLPYVADQLGHTLATATRYYTHLDNIQTDSQNADERIWAARGGRPETRLEAL